VFVADGLPSPREEDTVCRCQKLLQRPTSCKPFTRAKGSRIIRLVVLEKDIALHALSIPPIHRVDGLGELGTAALVNTAGVNPCITETSSLSNVAEFNDLLVPGTLLDAVLTLAKFFVGDLLGTPSMREDRVRLVWEIWEFLELERGSIEDTHLSLSSCNVCSRPRR
jgi:hypothetical protein